MTSRLTLLVLLSLALLLLVLSLWQTDRPPPTSELDHALESLMTDPVPLHQSEAIPENLQADWILIEKGARRLTLFGNGQPLKSYPIALGWNPVGPKEREGDGRTPEGLYFISGRNPQSKFHLSLRISYPSPEDVARAAAGGYPPGSDIMIHGLPNGLEETGPLLQTRDWTAGCVAVTNEEIQEIWRVVPDGTPVEILP